MNRRKRIAITALTAGLAMTLSTGAAHAATTSGTLGCPDGWGVAGAYIDFGNFNITPPGDSVMNGISNFDGEWNQRQAITAFGGPWKIESATNHTGSRAWCVSLGF